MKLPPLPETLSFFMKAITLAMKSNRKPTGSNGMPIMARKPLNPTGPQEPMTAAELGNASQEMQPKAFSGFLWTHREPLKWVFLDEKATQQLRLRSTPIRKML